MIDPVTEADLNAYVDDALDLTRRIEVEDHLARDPAAAARIMADLRVRDVLRAAVAGAPRLRPAPERTLVLAHRLDRGLAWKRVTQHLRRVAAMAVLVGAGWLAHSQASLSDTDDDRADQPAVVVADALHARHALAVRARMPSQRPVSDYDPAEVRAATGIDLPELPGDWRVRDVQIFPVRDGEGVEVSIEAAGLGPVSLFARRSPTDETRAPQTVRSDAGVTVHWRAHSSVYALTAANDEPGLGSAAARMAGVSR